MAFWTQTQGRIFIRSNMVSLSYLCSYNSAPCSMFRPNGVSVPIFVPVLVSVPASFFKNVINCRLKKYSYNNLLHNFSILFFLNRFYSFVIILCFIYLFVHLSFFLFYNICFYLLFLKINFKTSCLLTYIIKCFFFTDESNKMKHIKVVVALLK